jgi:hypothetical protein
MAHDKEHTDGLSSDAEALPAAESSGREKPRRRSSIWRWMFILIAVPLLLFVLYTLFVLSWAYSAGERAGYVQNFSKRGLIVKTWEGELVMVNMPGAAAEKFMFTVRDDSVAGRINGTLGKRVVLKYEQHIGVPTTLFGETGNFVVGVHVSGEDGPIFPQY